MLLINGQWIVFSGWLLFEVTTTSHSKTTERLQHFDVLNAYDDFLVDFIRVRNEITQYSTIISVLTLCAHEGTKYA